MQCLWSMANGKCTYYFGYGKKQVLRYSELKRALGTITHKMLSTQLKELEKDDLIIRNEYPQVPPKVEYSLSPRGLTLMPVLECLCKWGHEHINDGDNHG